MYMQKTLLHSNTVCTYVHISGHCAHILDIETRLIIVQPGHEAKVGAQHRGQNQELLGPNLLVFIERWSTDTGGLRTGFTV